MRVTTSNPKHRWEGELGVECVPCGLRTLEAVGMSYMTADSTCILKSYSNILIRNWNRIFQEEVSRCLSHHAFASEDVYIYIWK